MAPYRETVPPPEEAGDDDGASRTRQRQARKGWLILAACVALLIAFGFLIGGEVGAVTLPCVTAAVLWAFGRVGPAFLAYARRLTGNASAKLARETTEFLKHEEDEAIRTRVFLPPVDPPMTPVRAQIEEGEPTPGAEEPDTGASGLRR